MLTNEILFLAFGTAFIMSLLILLLGYLVTRKAIDIKRRKSIDEQKERYQPLIFTYLLDEGYHSRGLTPKTDIQKIAIEELLSHYGKVLEGEKEKERLHVLAKIYLEDYYRNRIKSRKWSYRMNALYHIEDFNLTSLFDDVYHLLDKKRLSQEELVHILRILASFQYKDLNKMLTERCNYLSGYEYRNILIRLDHVPFDQFVLGFHKCQNQLKNAILDVIAVKKELRYLSFTENIFSAYSGEVKLRALKALAELGHVKNIHPFFDLLTSTKWEERMVTAKLFGSLKEPSVVPRLIELLQDKIWWVRFQAGHAIAQYPNGKEILQTVFETSPDPYARDMAWEWIHKGV